MGEAKSRTRRKKAASGTVDVNGTAGEVQVAIQALKALTHPTQRLPIPVGLDAFSAKGTLTDGYKPVADQNDTLVDQHGKDGKVDPRKPEQWDPFMEDVTKLMEQELTIEGVKTVDINALMDCTKPPEISGDHSGMLHKLGILVGEVPKEG